MRMLLPALACAVIFARCKDKSRTTDDNLSMIPFKEFKFDSADIKPGTPVSILAFTGSKDAEKHTAYYPQFIVVDRRAGDTLRILTTLIAVDDDSAGASKVVYSPPGAFNGNAQVLEAVFEARPEQEDMFLDLVADGTVKSPDDAAAGKAAVPRKEFVLVDKTVPIFMRPYKTAVGVLRFHQRPW
jgi:hypothetical protein